MNFSSLGFSYKKLLRLLYPDTYYLSGTTFSIDSTVVTKDYSSAVTFNSEATFDALVTFEEGVSAVTINLTDTLTGVDTNFSGTVTASVFEGNGEFLTNIDAAKIDGVTVDMTTTSPSNGNFLKYDGTDWVPASNPSTTNATKLIQRTVATDTPNDAEVLGWNNGASQWEPTSNIDATKLDGKTVDMSSAPNDGDVLTWDSTGDGKWEPAAAGGGSSWTDDWTMTVNFAGASNTSSTGNYKVDDSNTLFLEIELAYQNPLGGPAEVSIELPSSYQAVNNVTLQCISLISDTYDLETTYIDIDSNATSLNVVPVGGNSDAVTLNITGTIRVQ